MLAALFMAPASLHAADVRLAWDPSPDATVVGYTVYYGTAPGSYSHSVDVGNKTTHTLTGLAIDATYYFTVRAYTATRHMSPPSNEARGLPGFTDTPLVAGVHSMRLVHITELRARVNALRARFKLAPATWSGAMAAGSSMVRASHIVELRTALGAVYLAAKRTPPAYSDSGIAPRSTRIKAAHVTELRAAILALE